MGRSTVRLMTNHRRHVDPTCTETLFFSFLFLFFSFSFVLVTFSGREDPYIGVWPLSRLPLPARSAFIRRRLLFPPACLADRKNREKAMAVSGSPTDFRSLTEPMTCRFACRRGPLAAVWMATGSFLSSLLLTTRKNNICCSSSGSQIAAI